MGVAEKAYAKINLSLDITGKRADGYHFLETVMQSVSLHDSVFVEKAREITVDCPGVPVTPEENIACKAARAFFAAAGKHGGCRIVIEKNIPMQAGMGGGSADAAAVLRALNLLYETDYSFEKIREIGLQAGADVPFCIEGGTQLARGIGEILSPLPFLPSCGILIGKPREGVSTKEAYAAADLLPFGAGRTERMCQALKTGCLQKVAAAAANIFDEVLCLPEKDRIKAIMRENGALCACMTGSGSAVFGLFADKDAMERCAGRLRESGASVYETEPVDA